MIFGFLVAALLFATDAWAQASNIVPSPAPWRLLVGVMINTAVVSAVVWLIKRYLPLIEEKYGYTLPIIATALGPVLMSLQAYLTKQLGYEGFDFTPISAALTGSLAVAAHQVYKQ